MYGSPAAREDAVNAFDAAWILERRGALAGADEAGRGALAGPLVAAAVVLLAALAGAWTMVRTFPGSPAGALPGEPSRQSDAAPATPPCGAPLGIRSGMGVATYVNRYIEAGEPLGANALAG